MLRFFIKDEKKSRRTALQEIEIQPLHVHGDTSTIAGTGKETFVFALHKFTIPNKKYLSVQMIEKNGGRNLELFIRNRILIKAKSIY
jgi:hypothetical protein